MINSSGRGGAQERSAVVRRLGTWAVVAGSAMALAAAAAGLSGPAAGSPLSLRVLGTPPVLLVAPDQPVSSSSPPVAVTIPALGVSSILEGLRLAGGSVQTPRDPNRVGWYSDGPAPGDHGAAVLVGHLDSRTGPAVFWRLAALVPGDQVIVRRADGRTLTFVVDHSVAYPRTDFPAATVFTASGAELHLITCNGSWDRQVQRYDHTLVVFARLVDAHGASAAPSTRPPKQAGAQ